MLKTTMLHWQGSATAGAFNVVVTGQDNARLEDGTYFFRTEPITTYDNSGDANGKLYVVLPCL